MAQHGCGLAACVRALGASALCTALIGALGGAANAQERGYRRSPRAESDRADGPHRKFAFEVMPRVYGAAPAGDAITLGGPTVKPVDYSDIFGIGVGFGVVAYMPIYLREPDAGLGRLEFALGPLLALDSKTYPGQRDVDSAGDSLEPEDMQVFTALLGFHARLRTGLDTSPVRFSLGAHLGIGLARIDQVDAVLDLSGSGLGVFSGTLYDSTTTLGFELIVRPGISFQVDPEINLTLYGLLGFGIMGAPESAGSATNPIADARAHELLSAYFGVGVSVTIRIRK